MFILLVTTAIFISYEVKAAYERSDSRVLTTDSSYSTSSYVDIVIDLNGGSATWFGNSSYADCFNGPYVFLYDYGGKSLSSYANLTTLWNYNTDALILSNGGGRGVHFKTKGTTFYYYAPSLNASFYSVANPQSKIVGTSVSGSKITIQYRFDVQAATPYMILPQVTKTGYNFTDWTVKTESKWYVYEYKENDSAYTAKMSGNVPSRSTIAMKDSAGTTWYLLHMGQTSRYDTITANYTPWTHTVAYNANGGSGAPSNQTKTYGTDLTLSSTKPTRAGYEFTGWNTKSDGTGTSYNAGATYKAAQNGGTETLYAQWKDITAPTIAIDMPEGWATDDVGVSIKAEDAQTGIASIEVTYDSKAIFEKTYSGESSVTKLLSFTNEQNITYTVTATDKAGNSSTATFTVKIDKTAPSETSITNIMSVYGWTNEDVTIKPTVKDSGSGIKSFVLKDSSGTILESGTTSLEYTFTTEGSNEYILRITDNAGHIFNYNITVKIDKTIPTISNISSVYGWTNENVTIKPTSSDNLSGIASLVLTNSSGTEITSGTESLEYTFSTEGSDSYILSATDMAGNITTTTFTVKIDKTVPTSQITASNTQWTNNVITINGSGTDTLSGMKYVYIEKKTASGWVQVSKSQLNGNSVAITYNENGATEFRVYSEDVAGNKSGYSTVTVKHDDIKPTITVTQSNTGWSNAAIAITTNVSDTLSGISKIYVEKLNDNGNWVYIYESTTANPSTYTFSSDTDGINSYRIYSVDIANNTSEYVTVTTKVDDIKPKVSIKGTTPDGNGAITLNIEGYDVKTSDEYSGLKSLILYTVNNQGVYTEVDRDVVGNGFITHISNVSDTTRYVAKVIDIAGNETVSDDFYLYKQAINHNIYDKDLSSYLLYKTTYYIYAQDTVMTPFNYQLNIPNYLFSSSDEKYVVSSEGTSNVYYIPNQYIVHFVNEHFGTTSIVVYYSQTYSIPTALDRIFDVNLVYNDNRIVNTTLNTTSYFEGYKDSSGTLYKAGDTLINTSASGEDVYYYSSYKTAASVSLPSIQNFNDRANVGWYTKPQSEGNNETPISEIVPTTDLSVYVYWNEAPTINTGIETDYYRAFYNGQTIGKKELLFNIVANDLEDKDLSIKIESIKVKMKDGSVSTWYDTLDKLTIQDALEYKVTYSVIDNGTTLGSSAKAPIGNTAETKWYPVYDNTPPIIIATNKYIYTKDTSVTIDNIENILTNAQKVIDKEQNNDLSYWLDENGGTKVVIEKIEMEDVAYTEDLAEKLMDIKARDETITIEVTYKVKDNLGLVTTTTGEVHFVNVKDDVDVSEYNSYTNIRFISLSMMDTLSDNSTFKTDTLLKQILLDTLKKDENSEVTYEGKYKDKKGGTIFYKRYY